MAEKSHVAQVMQLLPRPRPRCILRISLFSLFWSTCFLILLSVFYKAILKETPMEADPAVSPATHGVQQEHSEFTSVFN